MRRSKAFAPAAISNFFTIHDEGASESDYESFANVGATGGGFILSKGVYTEASYVNGRSPIKINVAVNANPNYEARTTHMAVRILLERAKLRGGSLRLSQRVEVPIGYGFGASAASALSAVIATASAVDLPLSGREVALAAHVADILSRTGLGTVSAIFGTAGAGAITRPGAPGIAEFLRVRVPRGKKLVTASLAPYEKAGVLASAKMKKKVNRLGREALERVVRNPTLEELARSGGWFAQRLGLETVELRKLIEIARRGGALWASQNMIGYSIHCIVEEGHVTKVASGLLESSLQPDVRTFDFGREKSGVLD